MTDGGCPQPDRAPICVFLSKRDDDYMMAKSQKAFRRAALRRSKTALRKEKQQ